MRNLRKISGIILVIAVMSGCRPSAPVAPAQNTTQIVTGILQSVKLTDVPGTAIVSIKTENGTQNVTVSNNTSVAIAGQACTLDEINLFNIEGQSYNCTAVYNACDGNVFEFNVVKIFN